jgi:hypothetical protein
MKLLWKLLITLLLIVILMTLVDSKSLFATLHEISLPSLALLMVVSIPLILISVVKWRLFLRAFGADASIRTLCSLYLLGYFVNALLPSSIGGDLARSMSLGQTVGKGKALQATFMERYTGLVAMLLCCVIAVSVEPTVTPAIVAIVVSLGLMVVLGSFFALSPYLISVIANLPFIGQYQHKMKTAQASLRSLCDQPRLLIVALALSIVFHLLAVINTIVAGLAVGWTDIELLKLVVVLPLILIIGSLPITPSGLGLQEGAFFFFLQQAGASPSQALAVGLVLRAKWYILALVGGVVWITGAHQVKSIES